MGFDVFGPTRHVQVSSVDRGGIFALPRMLGLGCPQLEKLSDRFYDSITLRLSSGDVHRLRDEVIRLQAAYCDRRGPELIMERGVRARDTAVRADIVEQLLSQDPANRALERLRLLCDEAIAAGADVRCEGD